MSCCALLFSTAGINLPRTLPFFFWQHIFPNPQPVALPCLVAAIFREKDETKMRVVKDV